MSLDTFLDDLDELDSDSDEETQKGLEQPTGAGGPGNKETDSGFAADLDELDDMDEDGDGVAGTAGGGGSSASSSAAAPGAGGGLEAMLEAMSEPRVADVVSLSTSDRFKTHMAAVGVAMGPTAMNVTPSQPTGSVTEDPEYRLVVASNDIAVEIEDEIASVHKFVCDIYSLKFPELEQMVPNGYDYCRVVQRIANEMDMTMVDLNSVLPPSQVMVVTVTGSTTNGAALTPSALERCLEGCDLMTSLDSSKNDILRFVQSRMSQIAPNLSAVLSSEVAATLMGFAGGLVALSKIPSCNLQVMGQKKRTLGGFSTAAVMPHCGMIYHAPLIQSAPVPLRQKACRVLAGKVALAARSDAFQTCQDGSIGRKYYAEIKAKIEKWQEPPPAKAKKSLPKPDDMPSRKRGGKRLRKQKERYGLTDIHKEAQRLHFASEAYEYSDAAMGLTFGALGKEGSGRLRKLASQKEKKTAAKQQKMRKVNYGTY